jgi:hypothetical protein
MFAITSPTLEGRRKVAKDIRAIVEIPLGDACENVVLLTYSMDWIAANGGEITQTRRIEMKCIRIFDSQLPGKNRLPTLLM